MKDKQENQEKLGMIEGECEECYARKPFSVRIKEFFGNRKKYETEHEMMLYSLYALALLIMVQLSAYFAFFRQDPSLLGKYGWWILYSDIALVSIGAAMWHIKSYRMKFNHMNGMMVGMTFGMISGFMIGTVIGATNGMLVGSFVGLIVGVAAGWYNGKCCGIMGVMEGMMAGMMGGIMGAMTGVMLYVDHILYFMPLFTAVNLLIMWGLSYMLYEEIVEKDKNVQKIKLGFWKFFLLSLIFSAVMIMIMLYAPSFGLTARG